VSAECIIEVHVHRLRIPFSTLGWSLKAYADRFNVAASQVMLLADVWVS